MGLPWPLAGAGMSVMPKPGKWMMTVKYVFGVFIILFGVYYGYFAYSLAPFGAEKANQEADSVKELKNTLVRAKENGKPVFVDVWATWCKTCVTMNKTTFKDAEVKQVLADFEVVKFQAEDPGAPEIKPILESLKLVGGLPYYVILEPEQN
jgi:thiol:disulfide interchange protein